VLGTKSVRRLPSAPGVQVWAATRLSRQALLRGGRAPGVVVVCRAGCRLRSSMALDLGRRARKANRVHTAAAIRAGQSRVLWASVAPRERPALRRARRPRAAFSVTVRPAGGRPRKVRRAIGIR
jgi:hypothetical protein